MVLSILSIWSARSSTADLRSTKLRKGRDEPAEVTVKPAGDVENNGAKDNVDAVGISAPIGVDEPVATPVETTAPTSNPSAATEERLTDLTEVKERPAPIQQRFSFRSFRFFHGSKAAVTHEEDVTERKKAKAAAQHKKFSKFMFSTDKRAQKDALAVQRLIIGSGTIKPANTKTRPAPVSRTQMTRIRSELMKPKAANKIIIMLRSLPELAEPSDEPKLFSAAAATVPAARTSSTPIHAVCLESAESDIQTRHFSKLKEQSVIFAGIDSLTSLFSELHIIDLLAAPDLGLGQPADGKGLLAGAIPTAETIIEGATQITPQLMALGYATGKAIFPDHSEIYPPTDRMSVLTYWWGLELCLPPPTLAYLAQAPNISHQVINFLTAMSLMYNGVREVLPFVRYIGQFIDFEWGAIEKQDKGKGVVCAATWIMPPAMVPRPWDFPDPPAKGSKPAPEQPNEPEVKPTPTPNGPLPPALVFTPPSVIRSASSQETSPS